MNRILKFSCMVIGATLACGGSVSIGMGGAGVGAGVSKQSDYVKSINEWHDGRIQRLTAEDGWLTLVGLFPLSNGTHTFGSASDNDITLPAGSPGHAGSLTVQDSVVTLAPLPDAGMTLDGKPATETPLASDASESGPTRVQMGSMQFYVISRSSGLYLRVKDANSPVRKNFKGIDRFPVSDKWRVDAVFERYNPPHPVKIPNVLGFEETVQCPGVLVFKINGQTYRLEPMAQEGDQLSIVFGDASSGHDTYGGGRELYVPMPGPDGKTVVDFNKAYNPPCVFTTFATCPLPHRENILPFRVEAGEKMWGDSQHAKF